MRTIYSVVSDLLTARQHGTMDPVVDAMKRYAVLLLDEIDLASNKIMCLQPILEGKGTCS